MPRGKRNVSDEEDIDIGEDEDKPKTKKKTVTRKRTTKKGSKTKNNEDNIEEKKKGGKNEEDEEDELSELDLDSKNKSVIPEEDGKFEENTTKKVIEKEIDPKTPIGELKPDEIFIYIQSLGKKEFNPTLVSIARQALGRIRGKSSKKRFRGNGSKRNINNTRQRSVPYGNRRNNYNRNNRNNNREIYDN